MRGFGDGRVVEVGERSVELVELRSPAWSSAGCTGDGMETQAAALDSLDGLDQLFRNHGWLDGALGWVTMCPDGPGDGRDRGGDVRLRAVMRGYVQGVGFRYFVLERVRGTGLRGWVRNRGDGSVECVAEGPRARLERLVEELRKGPRWAEVSDVEIDWQPARGDLPEFRVTG